MAVDGYSSPLLHLLQQQLGNARVHDAETHRQNTEGTPIHVSHTGKIISTAYEQLRNAAEYTEEHLLLQRAIKRYYYRNFSLFAMRHGNLGNVGEELIVELTQAGYLRNGQFSTETADKLRRLAEEYFHTYTQLREARISRDNAMDWAISLLSVESEAILSPHTYFTALVSTAYQHYLQLFPKEMLVQNHTEAQQYELCLYIAIHQALLKSDIAEVRDDLMHLYGQSPQDIHAFIQFNKTVTELYVSKLTHRIKRIISKHAAPFRIVKSMADERDDLPELLADRGKFIGAFSHQVSKEYHLVGRRVNKGIIKSILFIFITKVIIGVGIEVPYDLVMFGAVSYMPLAINLAFPPLYMASLKLGIKVPSLANADALRDYMDTILYSPNLPALPMFRDVLKTASTFSKWFFSILFFIPFAITIYVLHLLNFNIVQGSIFFIFLSTASFFGFRLSGMVRELELVTQQLSLLSTIRDFFYLPFILVGQWLSSKYAKVNAVGYFLDIAIELPLKTVLRLIRQWTRFLSEKHDEIY